MSIKILEKALYVLNHDEENLELREPPKEFDEYINNLVVYINANQTIRMYKQRSEDTQIVNSVRGIIELDIEDANEKEEKISTKMKNNADRLFRIEQNTQEKINRLDVKIKKGSLVQVLCYNEDEDNYEFLIAKVEHNEFWDDKDFNKRSGFSIENNRLWKSCLFKIQKENFEIIEAKVFLDNQAKYWYDDFLELDPMNDDEENTSKAFKAIDNLLNKKIKKESPSDYLYLRNGVICFFKNNEFFDYDNLMLSVFDNYESDNINRENFNGFLDTLKDLPNNKFERQFNVVKKAIKARVRKIYHVNDDIELKINDGIDGIKDIIKSYKDEYTGEKYIQIKTNDDETYNSFL